MALAPESTHSEVLRVRRLMQRQASKDRRWQILNYLTEPWPGIGFFALGLGTAYVADFEFDALSFPKMTLGLLLVWMGYRLVVTPVLIRGYFINHPEHLSPFIRHVQAADGDALPAMMEWFRDNEPEARRYILRLRFLALLSRSIVKWGLIFLALLPIAVYVALLAARELRA